MAWTWVYIANLMGPPGDANAMNRFNGIDATIAALDTKTANRDTVIETKNTQQDGRLNTIEATSVTSATDLGNRLEFIDELDQPFLTVEDISRSPYFKGNPTAVTSPIDTDSFEFVDDLGNLIFAVDDLTSGPHLRGGSGGGSTAFTETHFIVLVGQSNSVGLGTPSPVGTNTPVPNLFVIPQRGGSQGVERQAVDPLAHPYADPAAGTVGHGWTVARQYALDNPSVRVVILPMAMSGSGFFYSSQSTYTWAPSRVGEAGMTNLYSEAISRCNTAIAAYASPKRVAMFLWHQGEADAVGGTTDEQYEAEMLLLSSGLRSNIAGAADAPFIVGQMGWEFRNVRMPGTWAQIDAAHQNTANVILRSAFAPAPPAGHMLADNTHFTGKGQKLLAQSIINVLQDAHFNI